MENIPVIEMVWVMHTHTHTHTHTHLQTEMLSLREGVFFGSSKECSVDLRTRLVPLQRTCAEPSSHKLSLDVLCDVTMSPGVGGLTHCDFAAGWGHHGRRALAGVTL